MPGRKHLLQLALLLLPLTARAQTAVQDPRILSKSRALDIEAVDLAAGDLDGDGGLELILAGKDTVQAYALKDGDLRLLSHYKDSATAVQFLSVDAADLDGNGRAEVFVSQNNRFFGRLESFVLVLDSGSLVRAASLPWLLRGFHDAGGVSLAAQQVLADSSFPFSSIRRLAFSQGRYVQSDPPLQVKRLEWLYGFALSRRDREPVALLTNAAQRIRVQSLKEAWTSRESYGQTANRSRWQERTLLFHPRLLTTEGPQGLQGVHVMRAIPRFGVLAESQGLYSRSELHHLRFNGSGLEPAWTVELPGYSPGLAELAGGPGREAALLVAVVSAEGTTSGWTIRR
ncbi:MAG: VCBS repeat-containing protein [Elusimicrobiota bacterium]